MAEPRVIKLKTWPEHFSKVVAGAKPFELRFNDRDFQQGDILVLQEYDPIRQDYTGREETRRVTCIVADEQFGLQHGYVALGMAPLLGPIFPATDGEVVQLHVLAAWHAGQGRMAVQRAENWRNSAADADRAAGAPTTQGDRYRACLNAAETEANFHLGAAKTLTATEEALGAVLKGQATVEARR